MRAMILAAGLGTRFKPWTDHHPKALALVHGKSLLQRNIEYLQQYGVDEVVVNVHHFADQIEEALHRNKGWGSTIAISDERDVVLETGGGLLKAAPMLRGERFVLMNVDILTDMDLRAMIQFHDRLLPVATLAVSDRNSSRSFLFDHFHNLCGWRNSKTGEEKVSRTAADMIPKAFSGIHVIEPALLNLVKRTGKFSMVDVYLDLAVTEIIKGFDHTGARLIDVGKPESVVEAERLFATP